jgi:hypothetical protein
MIGYLAIKKKVKSQLLPQSDCCRYGTWMEVLNSLTNIWKERRKIYKQEPS